MILGPFPDRWARYERVRRAAFPYLVIATLIVLLASAEGLLNGPLR